jgi:transcriptional regulator with XRE-family HTH domain
MLIGQRIRRLREQKALTQGDIEGQTGMPSGCISRVECGHVVPCLKTLERFARALGVPMYQLFYNAERGALPVAVDGSRATLEDLAQATDTEGSDARFLLKLKGLIRNMRDSDRAFLMAFARKLANRH